MHVDTKFNFNQCVNKMFFFFEIHQKQMQMMYLKKGPKIRFNFNQHVSSSKYSLPLNKQQMNDDIKSNFHNNYDCMMYGMHQSI